MSLGADLRHNSKNPWLQNRKKGESTGFALHRPPVESAREPAAMRRKPRWTRSPSCDCVCDGRQKTGQGGFSGRAGLVHRHHRDRLCDAAVRHRQSWRPALRVDPWPGAAVHLCAQPRHLLHLLDLLRLGRPLLRAWPRIPRHLHGAGAGLCVRLPAAQPPRQAGQDREDHLDRRLPRRPLRQELHRRGDRHADRDHRGGAVYGAAIEGDLRLGQPDGRALYRLAALLRSIRQRHLARSGDAACAVRGAVRHPPCRRHRASGRAGAGGVGGNRGPTRRLPPHRPVGYGPGLLPPP